MLPDKSCCEKYLLRAAALPNEQPFWKTYVVIVIVPTVTVDFWPFGSVTCATIV
jgi:hypothetical protein